jgi:hypothetical protein
MHLPPHGGPELSVFEHRNLHQDDLLTLKYGTEFTRLAIARKGSLLHGGAPPLPSSPAPVVLAAFHLSSLKSTADTLQGFRRLAFAPENRHISVTCRTGGIAHGLDAVRHMPVLDEVK